MAKLFEDFRGPHCEERTRMTIDTPARANEQPWEDGARRPPRPAQLICNPDLGPEANLSHRTGAHRQNRLLHLDMAPRFDPANQPDTRSLEPAPFAVTVSTMADHEVRVSVEGELDLVSAPELEETLKRQLLASNDVLLDLSSMDFIDSTGLHAIVESVRTAKAVGRKLKLSADLPQHARRLMEIVGLLPFIPITPE